MSAGLIVIIVVVVLAAGAGTFWFIRRRRWIKAVAAKGWTFEGANDVHWYRRFGCPPFDIGFERSCKDRITGAVSGSEFVWFRYRYDAQYNSDKVRLNALGVRLPAGLPELYLTPRSGGVRRWIPACTEVGGDQRTVVRARDRVYAEELLGSPFWTLAQQDAGPVDLAIDNNHIVAVGVDDDIEEIERVATFLSGLAAAIPAAVVERFRIEPKRHKDLFYDHDWTWRKEDPRWVTELSGSPFGEGEDRKALGVVSGTDRGVRFTAFKYQWVTVETRTTGSGRNRRSRTERVTHHQSVLAVELPKPFPKFQIKPNQPGFDGFAFFSGMQKVKLESEDFNRAFHVRAQDPKFAYDVLHPRTMELLMRQPIAVATNGTYLVRMEITLTTEGIADAVGEVTTVLGAIPNFVWDDLGVASPVRP